MQAEQGATAEEEEEEEEEALAKEEAHRGGRCHIYDIMSLIDMRHAFSTYGAPTSQCTRGHLGDIDGTLAGAGRLRNDPLVWYRRYSSSSHSWVVPAVCSEPDDYNAKRGRTAPFCI